MLSLLITLSPSLTIVKSTDVFTHQPNIEIVSHIGCKTHIRVDTFGELVSDWTAGWLGVGLLLLLSKYFKHYLELLFRAVQSFDRRVAFMKDYHGNTWLQDEIDLRDSAMTIGFSHYSNLCTYRSIIIVFTLASFHQVVQLIRHLNLAIHSVRRVTMPLRNSQY